MARTDVIVGLRSVILRSPDTPFPEISGRLEIDRNDICHIPPLNVFDRHGRRAEAAVRRRGEP